MAISTRSSTLFILGIVSILGESIAFGPTSRSSKATSALSVQPGTANTPCRGLSSSGTEHPPFQLQHIDHIVIRCKKFPAMFDFYHRILGCTIDEPRSDHVNRFGGALTHLRAGTCYIDLLAYDTNHLSKEGKDAVARMHSGGAGADPKFIDDVDLSSYSSTLDHLCLRVEPFDAQKMLEYLEREKVPIVTSGDKRLGADGIGPSIYVRDPEGNVVELKGSPYRKTDEATVVIQTDITKSTTHKSERGAATSKTRKQSDPFHVPVSPCNRICRYNASFYDGEVCIGCFREAYEIKMWQSMSPLEKSIALLDAIDRRNQHEEMSSMSLTTGEKNFFEAAVTQTELAEQCKFWASQAERN
mmetsp:Transcript_18550/g.38067  ORF Transcript_18550/g.38067 Transcript_18550/m.38067 type:complete len:358 (+) Transcript_18550:104-1177(+)